MPHVIYPVTSPYATTPQNSQYLTNYVGREIPSETGDLLYQLENRHTYRPDVLSNELYSTPVYYWVFCVRNAFLRKEPLWGFVEGLIITVPSADYLRKIIG